MHNLQAHALKSSQVEDLLSAFPIAQTTVYEREFSLLESSLGERIYSEAIYRIFRIAVPALEGKTILFDIFKHHSALTSTLGRDVGLVTAAADYLISVNPLVATPVLIDAHVLSLNEENAYKDELTGLFNRRYLNQELPREIDRFRRFGLPFSILMLDINKFKQFNDELGHLAGDLALQLVANSLNCVARLYDRVMRFGGDEFIMILPQATQKEAVLVAERIHAAINSNTFTYEDAQYQCPTVSIGVASFPIDALDMNSLVGMADKALYRAKLKMNKIATCKDANRRHPRFRVHKSISSTILQGADDKHSVTAKDISFGGLLCHTTTKIEQNATIDLTLADNNLGLSLPLKARVCRVQQISTDEYEVALSFNLSTQEKKRIFLLLADGCVSTDNSVTNI